uniref:Acyl-CoA dehydrogenase/oxidase N-terminal domain-containing protein n=1 Tax=Streptomyces avermitilis TaxID=33903 RepID=A0A499VF41_STRAX|nr:hypothetical protein SAVMC3_48310 [Streptomyces avermitilis]
MHLAPTERQQRLRAELRTYFRDLMPDGPPPADDPGRQRALLRRIGADGLLGLGWPVAYGGKGVARMSSSCSSTRRTGRAHRCRWSR